MKYFLDTFGLDSEVAFESCLGKNLEKFNMSVDLIVDTKLLINGIILKVVCKIMFECNYKNGPIT